jgi:hypothetical protein
LECEGELKQQLNAITQAKKRLEDRKAAVLKDNEIEPICSSNSRYLERLPDHLNGLKAASAISYDQR